MSSDPVEEFFELNLKNIRQVVGWVMQEYVNCVIRDANGIPKKVDVALAKSPMPMGGEQMMDLAYSNRMGFYKEFVMKLLGDEIDDEDEIAKEEKLSIKEVEKIISQWEEKDARKDA